MPKYNHALTIAFEAIGSDPYSVSDEEFRAGLIKRVEDLERTNGWSQVNVDAPFDTYGEGDEHE